MKKAATGSIYSRLFRSYFATFLIPVLCIAVLTVLFTREFSMKSVKNELSVVAKGVSGVLQRELDNYEESLLLFSSYESIGQFLKDADPDEDEIIQVNQKMYLITGGKMQSLQLHLVDTDGRIVHSTSGKTGMPDNAHSYWGILRTLRNSQGPVLYSGVYGSEDPGLTLAVPVYCRGEAVGYAMLCVTEKGFSEILSSYATELPLNYMIIDSNYCLVMDTVFNTGEVFLPITYRELVHSDRSTEYERNGDQMVLAAKDVGDTGLTVAVELSVGLVVSNSRSLTVFVIVLCLAALIISLQTSHHLAQSMVEPIHTMCDTIHEIEAGNMDARVPELGDDELGTMGRGFNLMIQQLQEQFHTNLERQDRLRIAEFKNLQAQISPHFLYNTLESIKYMARLGMNEEIDIVVSKLGILLRSGINFKQDMIPLRNELKVVESYVAIQQIRYEGKFSYTADISADLLDCMVPNLVIQPLVENAVVHGIEEKVGHGELRLTGREENGDIYIEIYDNGRGIAPEKISSIFRDEHSGEETLDRERIGMVNVHRRLKLYFGEPYGLSVESEIGCYTRVRLHIPKVEGSESHVQSGNR